MLEPWLAFFHISAFLGWIVFASAQAALCRTEWLNAAVVPRLVRLDAADAQVALQRAEVSMQLTVQVRNKLVQAYQDLMRMPI